MRELALFAGAGGGILGSKLLGWRTVCAVEIDPYCRDVLFARQKDGCLDPFPIWDDVRTFNGIPWRGHIDVVTGGFPCQDISAAGKGAGIKGRKSSLWFEMARIIREVRPRFVLVENSPMLTVRGIDRVLGSLAALGYDARWCVLGAIHAGAPHRRLRIWIRASRLEAISYANSELCLTGGEQGKRYSNEAVANADSRRRGIPQKRKTEQPGRSETIGTGDVSDAESARWARGRVSVQADEEPQFNRQGFDAKSWPPEPDVGRVAYGVAHRVDRLRAIGNGQVPRVVALAWEVLKP